ncbi:MAG: hypothetical protein LWW95_09365 [Candidatus Desulfofervidus auxilii]|nr:hypothetical protein [Candidatus Desulfofervidus auxilii]
MRKLAILIMIFCFIFSTIPVMANEGESDLIIWDLLLARPIGLIGIGIGTSVFLISLPFTLPSKSVKSAGKKLVIDPFNYTFKRKLGHELL